MSSNQPAYLLVGERVFPAPASAGGETAVVSVYTPTNNGFTYTGSYAAATGSVQYPRSISEIRVADVTGDGVADVLATVDTRPTIGLISLAILPSKGDGTLLPVSATLTPPANSSGLNGSCYYACTLQAVTGDFAGRGKIDIAFVAPPMSSNSSAISLFPGNGDGTFQRVVTVPTVNTAALSAAEGYVPRLAALDINGDGNLDLADSYGYAYLGDGKFTFTATGALIGGAPTYPTGCNNTASMPCGVTQILPYDVNADGITDLYLSRSGILLGQAGSSASLASISNLSAGTHSITAAYGGSSAFAVSTSQPVAVTVNQIATSLNVTATPNPVTTGGNLVISVTVVPATAGTATGTVTFSNGSTVLGTSAVTNNQASLITTLTTTGTVSLTAKYSGDSTFGMSSASVSVAAVQPFAVTPSGSGSTTLVGNYGKTVSTTVSVAAQNGFSGTVGLSCDSLPNGVACAFAPASLALSGSIAQTSTLTLTIGQTVGALHHAPFDRGAQVLAAILLGSVALAGRHKKLARLMALLVMGVVAMWTTGCMSSSMSGGSSPTSNAKTYTFRVLASSGGYQSATSYTLVVQ